MSSLLLSGQFCHDQESPAGKPRAEINPDDQAAIYAVVARQLYTTDHTFGKNAPNWPVLYLISVTDDIWKRGVHSKKPERFQDIIELVSPAPYLEMYARRPRLGWDVWGNEVESDISLGV